MRSRPFSASESELDGVDTLSSERSGCGDGELRRAGRALFLAGDDDFCPSFVATSLFFRSPDFLESRSVRERCAGSSLREIFLAAPLVFVRPRIGVISLPS